MAGHSLGGVIAYEMAQQLMVQGEQVAHLLLLDTFLPDNTNFGLEDDVDYLQAIFVSPDGREALPFPKNHLLTLTEEERLRFVYEKPSQLGLLPVGIGFEKASRLFNVAKSNIQAVNAYEPQKIPCEVIHFCATQSHQETYSDAGWASLVEGFNSLHLDTHHEGIIRGASVLRVAELFKRGCK